MTYLYGSGPDEVAPFFQAKRSWSNVKDKILGHYIDCYLKTVQHLQRRIVIVDGFAGPGIFGDDTPGSPLIICKSISDNAKGKVGIGCLFADIRAAHREALTRNLEPYIKARVSEPPFSDWSQAVSRALEIGAGGATLFFYLDPYGIKDLDFAMVSQIYERGKGSTEVLINFNFRAFMRMSGNWGYTDSADAVANKVKAGKTETVNRVMDGDYWKMIITDPSLNRIGRENAVVDAYMERVRRYFPYVYAIPVKERNEDEYSVPADELAHYHLIFGTRSPRAVVYMNDVAFNALEPYLSQFKDGLLFDMTPERYQAVGVEKAKAAIVDAVRARPLKRPEIWEEVFPRFFMHRPRKEWRAMVDDLTFREGRLFPDRRTMKVANKLNDETMLSATPWR